MDKEGGRQILKIKMKVFYLCSIKWRQRNQQYYHRNSEVNLEEGIPQILLLTAITISCGRAKLKSSFLRKNFFQIKMQTIFRDIFGKHSEFYKAILQKVDDLQLSHQTIAHHMNTNSIKNQEIKNLRNYYFLLALNSHVIQETLPN